MLSGRGLEGLMLNLQNRWNETVLLRCGECLRQRESDWIDGRVGSDGRCFEGRPLSSSLLSPCC